MSDQERVHDLKCWPIWFESVAEGAKTFEVRWNDRWFCAGDELVLREWAADGGYTGRECRRLITYVTDLADFDDAFAGYVGMSIAPVPRCPRCEGRGDLFNGGWMRTPCRSCEGSGELPLGSPLASSAEGET